jgi:hypothetical protein
VLINILQADGLPTTCMPLQGMVMELYPAVLISSRHRTLEWSKLQVHCIRIHLTYSYWVQ